MSETKQPKRHERLIGLWLVNSTTFGGHTESLTVGRNVDSIVPARMESDSRAVPLEKGQRADGFLVRKQITNSGTHEVHVAQVMVMYSNVREVQYGPAE